MSDKAAKTTTDVADTRVLEDAGILGQSLTMSAQGRDFLRSIGQ